MASGTISSNIAGNLSDEETNYLRAAHLIIHVCPRAVRKLFDSQHPPSGLTMELKSNEKTIKSCKGIYKSNWPTLFPSSGNAKSSEFDITLLMTLLRNFTLIPPPRNGWDTMPAANDHSEGGDLVRVRLYRNQILHSKEAKLVDSDFNLMWTELRNVIDRLSGGTMTTEVDDLQHAVLDQTQWELLLKQIQHDKELRDLEVVTKKHGDKFNEFEKKHREEMEAIKQKHEEEIYAIKQKLKENKQHGDKIKGLEQKHRQEIEAIKQNHGEEIKEIIQELNQPIPKNIRDQNKHAIQRWRNDDKVFFETSGYKGALKLLNSKNYLTIIGSPGAGKSTIAKHIALQMEAEGMEVVPVDNPDDIVRYGSVNTKQVFVIDDVVGVFNVEMPRLDAFLRRKENILDLVQNQTKLIMTCRKVVYNEAKKSKSLVTDFVLDLENSEFMLQEKDKKEILINHCKAAKLSKDIYENISLSNSKFMFPLLCKIFSKEKKYQSMGKQFFEKPYDCLIEKLEDMRDRQPLQYAVLVLLCLQKETTITEESIYESDETFLSLKKSLFDIYGVDHGTPASKIITVLSFLDGTYTRLSLNGFTFIHDCIFELVAYHHGKSYLKHMLEYSSSRYVNNRVFVDNPPSDGSLYITLEKKYYPLLAKRILSDIRAFKLYYVFNNSVFKCGEFLDAFIKILQETDFSTFMDTFLKSHLKFQNLTTNDINDLEEQSAKDKTGINMWWEVRDLLERDNTRVIRWIVFYGPTRLLEFIINHVERYERTPLSKNSADQVPVKKQTTKSVRTPVLKSFMNEFKKPMETLHLKPKTADQLTDKEQTAKLLFGDDEEQARLLLIGSLSGDVDRLRLIHHGARVDILDILSLAKASERGHYDIVRYLIHHGADPNLHEYMYTPLYIASMRGDYDIVKFLIHHGADPNLHECNYVPLSIAIQKGHCDIARYLIDHGANPNIPKTPGKTPLCIASERRHHDIVRYLIKHGANPNIPNSNGDTLLYIASERGQFKLVSYLIDHGADPNIPNMYGDTLLYIASERGQFHFVCYLIDHGADPNFHEDFTPLYIASKRGHSDIVRYLIGHGADPNSVERNTSLYIASKKGHFDIVRYLINHGADPNIPKMSGDTPLYIASERGHYDIVRYLLNQRADPNILGASGDTALYIETKRGHYDIVKSLIVHGADPNIPCCRGNTPLHIASETGHYDIVRYLIDHGADPNIPNKFGDTPLCIQSERGHFHIVRYLVNHGADPNVYIKSGNTPLYMASERGHYDIVKYLIYHGADPNIPDKFGDTPLCIESERGHYDIVRYLINHGADPNIPGKSGNTPLYIASERGHYNIVRYLIDYDADPNIPDGYGNTPLYITLMERHFDIARFLIDHGADPNIPGKSGDTPLYMASERGDFDIFRYLIDHGADPNIHKYNTPLYVASMRGHCDIIRYLIEHGADFNIPHKLLGNTPLYIASERGHCNIVRCLIDHGADPYLHKYGNTPLYIASGSGHSDIVCLLLDNSADVSISYRHGISPLQIALYLSKMDVVRMMMKKSRKLKRSEGNNPLYQELIFLKQLEINEEETRKGRVVYKGSEKALSEGLWDIITWRECGVLRHLLMLGLDVNHCDERGRSLLCRVICEGCWFQKREEKVKLLLESGADINIRDDKCLSVTEHTRQRVFQYKNLEPYNEYCNVFNVVKRHVRRYSL